MRGHDCLEALLRERHHLMKELVAATQHKKELHAYANTLHALRKKIGGMELCHELDSLSQCFYLSLVCHQLMEVLTRGSDGEILEPGGGEGGHMARFGKLEQKAQRLLMAKWGS